MASVRAKSHVMFARFVSVCPTCKQRIFDGEPIIMTPQGAICFRHLGCTLVNEALLDGHRSSDT